MKFVMQNYSNKMCKTKTILPILGTETTSCLINGQYLWDYQ